MTMDFSPCYKSTIVSVLFGLTAMAIQTLVFFLGFLFLVFLVIIPILYGQNLMFLQILGMLW